MNTEHHAYSLYSVYGILYIYIDAPSADHLRFTYTLYISCAPFYIYLLVTKHTAIIVEPQNSAKHLHIFTKLGTRKATRISAVVVIRLWVLQIQV